MAWLIVLGYLAVLGIVGAVVYYFCRRCTNITPSSPITTLPTPPITRDINNTSQREIPTRFSQRNERTKMLSSEEARAKISHAQYYDRHKNTSRNPKQAFNIYFDVAQAGYQEVLGPLKRLGEELGGEEHTKLSQLFTFFQDGSKADYWRNKVTEIDDFSLKDNTSGQHIGRKQP